jgi:hypothetical protein
MARSLETFNTAAVRTSGPLCVASQALKRRYPAYDDRSFDALVAALDSAAKSL